MHRSRSMPEIVVISGIREIERVFAYPRGRVAEVPAPRLCDLFAEHGYALQGTP